MGCDIHAYVEYRRQGERVWEYHSRALYFRDYQLFGLLAGVRGQGQALYEPRGVPLDMSSHTRWEYESGEGTDWHTPSWLNYDEFYNVVTEWWIKTRPFGSMLNNVEATLSAMETLKTYGDVRMVFWFDN
jgi:hypothetical protein